MSFERHAVWLRYGAAVAAVAAVLIAGWLLTLWLGAHAPLVLFLPAVVAAAFYGGVGPGLVATGLGALTGAYFFVASPGLSIHGRHDLVRVVLFLLVGATISVAADALRRSRDHERRRAAAIEAAAESVRRNQRLYQLAIAQVTGYAIFFVTPDGRIGSWNSGVEHVLGWSELEFVGQPLAITFPPEDGREAAAAELDAARAKGVASDDRWQIKKDGTRFWASGITTALYEDAGQFIGFLKVMRDLTEQRRHEERVTQLADDLQDRVAELETLLKVIPVGIAIADDRECRRIRVNPAFAAALDLPVTANASKTAPAGERPENFAVLDDEGNEVPDERLPMQIAAREGQETRGLALNVVHADGRVVRLLEYAAPLLDARGEPRGSVGAFVDVTERRHLEEQARRILESITDAFYLLDHEWRYAYVNQRALDYYGKRREDLIGKVVWDVFPGARGSIFQQQLERAARERISVVFEALSPVSGRWIEMQVYPSPEGVSAYFRDVTDRKRAEVRDRLLVRLDDATRALTEPEAIIAAAARVIGGHLDVDRCVYAEVDGEQRTVELLGGYCRQGVPLAGRFAVSAFGDEFGRLMRAGVPWAVDDTETDPRADAVREPFRQRQIGALICVPLLKGGDLVGGMAVLASDPRRWRDDEVELVESAAHRCRESLERASLTRGLVRKTRSLRLLADNGTRLLSDERPERLVGTLFAELEDLLGLELGFNFLLVDGDRGAARLVASHGIAPSARADLEHLDLSDRLCALTTDSRGLAVHTALQKSEDEGTAWLRALGVRCAACMPLVAGGAIGALVFGTRRRDVLGPDEVELLRAVSDQVSAAYARSRAAGALRDSEERLLQAVALSELGTFDADLRTDHVVVNPPGRAIFGWAPETPLTFAGLRERFHPEDRERVGRVLDAALAPDGPGSFEIEHRILRTDGPQRWIRVRGRVMFEATDRGRDAVRCLGTFLDVTDRRDAEERRELVLARERDARAEAERVIRMKDEFLATLSHELRTPLNAILGWSQLLRHKRLHPGDLQAALATIDRNARAQAHLIDDLLDMSRIISGNIRLDVRPVDVVLVATEVLESIQPAADAKDLEVRRHFGPDTGRVSGDPARLQQVFWNLLMNAVKFTGAGGRIEVSLACDGGQVEFSVRDTGVGIDAAFLPHVFERFRQQDSSPTRRHGGLGLGLAIVKQLVELHGGTVSVASEGPGRGAAFVVRLPAVPQWVDDLETARLAGPVPPGDAPNRLVSLAGVRAMVVDDEADARDLVRRVLEGAGATVHTSDSAEEALRALGSHRMDVLVSDIGMPVMDGVELISRVRQLPGDQSQIPAIALTAYARAEDRFRALRGGYQAHLAKPVDVWELVRAVAGLTSPSRGSES